MNYSFEEFRIHGLLWLVNKAVFHPRGYAIGFTYPIGAPVEDIQAHKVEPTGWTLYGDGEESWAFALPENLEDRHFRSVKELFDTASDLPEGGLQE